MQVWTMFSERESHDPVVIEGIEIQKDRFAHAVDMRWRWKVRLVPACFARDRSLREPEPFDTLDFTAAAVSEWLDHHYDDFISGAYSPTNNDIWVCSRSELRFLRDATQHARRFYADTLAATITHLSRPPDELRVRWLIAAVLREVRDPSATHLAEDVVWACDLQHTPQGVLLRDRILKWLRDRGQTKRAFQLATEAFG